MSEENRTLWRQEVLGNCLHCGKKNTYGLWSVYNLKMPDGNYDQVIRCLSCGVADGFQVTEQDWWRISSKFKPFVTDKSDDQQYNSGSGHYTQGRR